MAKKRRKKKYVEQEAALNADGLERAFPSSPSLLPKYFIYCRYPHNAEEGEGRQIRRCGYGFVGTYAAKKYVEALIDGQPFKWARHDRIVTANGVMIETREPAEVGRKRSTMIETIMEHEYTPREEEWQVPAHELRAIKQFLAPWPDAPRVIVEKATAKTAKAPVPKASREGLVHVGQICTEIGMAARDARSILRKARVEQPACGWAFPPDQVASIRAILLKGR